MIMMARHRKNKPVEEEDRIKKNNLISLSMSATREKRKTQKCKVVTVKIQSNKLNLSQRTALKMLFVEAKWIRNEMINFGENNSIFDYSCGDTIRVMDKDRKFITKERNFISAQQIQSVIAEVKDNIRSLSKLKQKGNSIGALNYVSEVKSIDLKQHGATYKIKSKTKMKIQGVPGDVKVFGLEQLDESCDFANAKLLNKPDGYYVAIVTYIDEGKIKDDFIPNTDIGVDMGVKNNITLSDGRKLNVFVDETDRLKKLQRELSRREKGSNNRNKTIKEIRKEYQKMSNIKEDISNKIVSDLKQFENIYFQDENIKAWKNKNYLANGSKKIQHSILGRVKTKLKNCERAYMLNKFVATTQTCKECGIKNKQSLSDRIYSCSCGYTADRDVHSANMMILFGKQFIGAERIELTPVEILSSTAPCGAVRRIDETGSF